GAGDADADAAAGDEQSLFDVQRGARREGRDRAPAARRRARRREPSPDQPALRGGGVDGPRSRRRPESARGGAGGCRRCRYALSRRALGVADGDGTVLMTVARGPAKAGRHVPFARLKPSRSISKPSRSISKPSRFISKPSRSIVLLVAI